jgi:glycosyltransferase involved in cell wall biosynthesis
MRILAFPREDANPYQRLLYDEMRRLGGRADYLGALTRSHTVNLALLPLELVARRLRGARLVHLHWVYGFSLPGAGRFGRMRQVSEAWFGVCLAAVRVLGMRLVWTVHNVLPHAPVFQDDVRARRRLARRCDLVIVHSPAALAELAAIGAAPRRYAIIPHGPLAPTVPVDLMRTPGSGPAARRLVFIGRVRDYKGVEDLLAAFLAVPPGVRAELVVAGDCDDPPLRSSLLDLAGRSGGRVALRLERLSDEEVSLLLAGADAVVLPFRRVTTSGSAILALSHGRPLVVPALPALADLPDDAVIRYDGTTEGLVTAMARIASADAETLARMSKAALDHSASLNWQQIAAMTAGEMRSLLSGTQAEET